jgi:hypothetical protein
MKPTPSRCRKPVPGSARWVCRLHQLVYEQLSGKVVVQQIVLGVDAALGGVRQYGAGDKGVQPIAEKQEPGLPRMPADLVAPCAAQVGVPRIRDGMGGGASGIVR